MNKNKSDIEDIVHGNELVLSTRMACMVAIILYSLYWGVVHANIKEYMAVELRTSIEVHVIGTIVASVILLVIALMSYADVD